jgi:hypothetical protein
MDTGRLNVGIYNANPKPFDGQQGGHICGSIRFSGSPSEGMDGYDFSHKPLSCENSYRLSAIGFFENSITRQVLFNSLFRIAIISNG